MKGDVFRDRTEAAHRLAAVLADYRGMNPLVLAIPRGAVPMAKIIAGELGGEVDVVLVRKLRAPGNPEFALGSVDESGWAYLAEHALHYASDEYLEREKQAQIAIIRERRVQYTPVHPPIEPKGRVVIVVDDGLATGSTMISALHALRARGADRLICAVPVSPPDALEHVRPYADETVCLLAPPNFYAVGQFYGDFPQVDDEEVIAVLREGRGTL
ncbi:MAG TPA: phosphoribosyltransferase family protein [Burkholderiales bacterium]